MNRRLRNAIVYGIIVSWTVFPVVSVLIATGVATLCSCSINEGSPTPCIIFSTDIGNTLYTLGVMGWLGIITLPTGGIALLIYTIFAVTEGLIARRNQCP